MSDPKQVIVVRTHYPDGRGGFFRPRTGKLMAQAAHASMKVFFDRGVVIRRPNQGHLVDQFEVSLTPAMSEWIAGLSTKIVVGCGSEEELRDLEAKADAAGIPYALVVDSGRTDFHGEATLTALAIGPEYPEDIDPLTRDLKLL